MLRNKKGFTLIEMLVVIAIIAVLVAIVMPIVGQSTIQAKAATDVANLRAVYAELNIRVISGDLNQQSVEEILNSAKTNPNSQMDPEAKICAVFDTPASLRSSTARAMYTTASTTCPSWLPTAPSPPSWPKLAPPSPKSRAPGATGTDL